jgi:hypothetical protein
VAGAPVMYVYSSGRNPRIYADMPRGNPKRAILIRLDPATIAEVQSYAGPRNLTSAIEAGLAWWLKRARRKAAAEPKADPPAKHLAPPAPRELATRGTRP